MPQPIFPIALLLEGRACLVVGSSAETLTRTRAFLEARARVVVVSSAPSEDIQILAGTGKIELHEREFMDTDMNGKWLAVLVDENPVLAARMAFLAQAARVFFCAVDQPEHNSYAHMAQARAGLLTIAISTAGQAPALGRRLREEFEALLTRSKMAEFIDKLAQLRARTPSAQRREVLGAAVAEVRLTGDLVLPE